MTEYEAIWRSLEASSQQATGYVVRRVQPQAICDIFLGVTQPENKHVLQIQLKHTSMALVNDLSGTRGLDIEVYPSIEGRSKTTIQLSLNDGRLTDIFDSLVQDILDVIVPAPSESRAISLLRDRLKRWQRFFEQTVSGMLSSTGQQGLYGELWFLRERLIPAVGSDCALQSWVGPGGAHQDFQLRSCAVEVKTTGTKEPQQLMIQSERQLDDEGLNALFLFHISIDIRESLGETLPEIVSSIREQLKGNSMALDLYEEKLIEIGFLPNYASRYGKKCYTIRASSFFGVGGAFPRITAADLKPGVGNVRYSIAVSECRHFVLSENDVLSRIIGADHGK